MTETQTVVVVGILCYLWGLLTGLLVAVKQFRRMFNR